MGKNLLLFAAAMLILPSAVWADSTTDFFFNGGTLTGTNAGLSLSGSAVDAVSGFGGSLVLGSNLGSVSFTTGALQSGTPQAGVFLPGGSFSMIGSGTNGIPAGVLFSGIFNQRTGWTSLVQNGINIHVLHGVLDGTWMGQSVMDVPMELFVETQGQSFSSAGQQIQGSILLPLHVPEPGLLAYLTMGMLGLGGSLIAKVRLG